jgi:hypothetical protein
LLTAQERREDRSLELSELPQSLVQAGRGRLADGAGGDASRRDEFAEDAHAGEQRRRADDGDDDVTDRVVGREDPEAAEQPPADDRTEPSGHEVADQAEVAAAAE